MAISNYYKKNEAANREFVDLGTRGRRYDPSHVRAIFLQKKHDWTWSLPAGAIEPGEDPVQQSSGKSAKRMHTIHPARIVGIFGGSGFRYRYSNGDEAEHKIVLFECYAHQQVRRFRWRGDRTVGVFSSWGDARLKSQLPRPHFFGGPGSGGLLRTEPRPLNASTILGWQSIWMVGREYGH
jgi:hypothetical protein